MMNRTKKGLQKVLLQPEEVKRLHKRKQVLRANQEQDLSAEESMSDWLGRLKLLHGVPFYYLVPNVSMLPLETIRFFYCNTIWLDYLQEGALSLGRSTASVVVHDQAFKQDVNHLALKGVRRQRKRAYGHLLQHTHTKLRQTLELETPIPATEKVSGFLLRSGVVAGWKGLQVEAFYDQEQKKPATLLRMDRMSPNVLLCLFEGVIKSFRIHEEPEVLHFGFDVNSEPPHDLSKSFRYPVNTDGHEAGQTVDTSIAPPLPAANFERSAGKRVLNINQLAGALHETLRTKVAYTGPFTSAEFALEMVEGVEAVNFDITL